MTPMKFQTRPEPVEVMQLTTDTWWEVARWCDGETLGASPHAVLKVETTLGPRPAYVGDYIIRSKSGEFFPCPKEALHIFYEEVVE